jgi:hypothetical protein
MVMKQKGTILRQLLQISRSLTDSIDQGVCLWIVLLEYIRAIGNVSKCRVIGTADPPLNNRARESTSKITSRTATVLEKI